MYEGPDDDRSSRASEARVDALLASVLDMSDIEDTVNTTVSATALPQHPAPDALLIKPSSVPSGPTRPPSTISCPPADPPPPHPSAPVTQSQSRADLITFTRKLLVPAITENARRRDPDADWDVLTVGASAVVTDEMCERFIQQAIMARAQLAEHDSRETPVHTADGGKERESGEAAELKTLREGEGEDPKHRNAKASSLDGRQEGSSAARPPASSSNRDIAEYAAGPSQPRHVKPILEDSVTGRTAHELPPAGRRPGPADADAMPLSEIPYLLKRSSTAAATSQHSNSTDTRATLVDQPAKMTSPSMDRAPNPRVHEREMPLPQHRPNVLTLPVPGIWYAKEGRAYADVVEVEFSVDPEIAAAARRWARRREEFDADATHVSVHLLCLPNAVVSTILQSVPLDAPPARVAQLVWEAGTKWPRRGTLLATMNSGSPGVSRTYFPDDLEDGPLDVTNTIQQGANMLRIVQLGDISGHTFVLYAGVPTQEEKNRSAVAAADSRDWAAFILRTSSSLVARG
ncbi:hypothetical protein OBBRIDRAFT_808316 [Obba rivulosa]|uniref:Uncharacterized protein n=1 Tax=Obba rivulosa TaxID=1052685 RepID=A0A8E2DF20_9APHY|nr:hypothetical protein OBBRIDRAFT_808316 [Obba rivulosa]